MASVTSKIKEYIKSKRESLSPSSITTYASILKNLYKRVFDDDEYNLDNFKDASTRVIHVLHDLPSNKRKTILSALVIITDNKDYRSLMLDDVKEYNTEISKQVKSKAQEDNWVDSSDVNRQLQEWKSIATLLCKKQTLSRNDFQQIQNYIILCLLGGSFIPPRRSKDYCDFKIKNIDTAKDNYMNKNVLIFNSYKTAKCYGEQKVNISTALKTILNKWIKINPTDYLLFDVNFKPLTSVKLNQRFNKIFGKKVSVNLLRHSYLTNKFGDTIPLQKQIKNDMTEMGSSSSMLNNYVKND